MDRAEIVKQRVLKNSGVGSRYETLALNSRMQIDVAITIICCGFEQAGVKHLETRSSLGYYVFHGLLDEPNLTKEDIIHKLSDIHLKTSPFMSVSQYCSMLTTTLYALRKYDYKVEPFIRQVWSDTLRTSEDDNVKKLLGVGPGSGRRMSDGDDVTQGLILKVLLEQDGGKAHIIKHFTKPTLGKMVLKHSLSGFEGVISRKDAGSLLSDQLGL